MDSGYLPGYELKAAYQRNMLCGMILAYITMAAIGLVVLLANQSATAHNPRGRGGKEAPSNATSRSTMPTRPAEASLYGLNPYAREHRGFMGFRRLRAAAQGPTLPTVRIPNAHKNESNGLIIDSIASFSTAEGDGDGAYVPFTDDYFLPADSDDMTVTLNREMQVLTRVDPEYPRVALDSHIEGRIAVLLYVDAQGRLTTFPDWLKGERRSLRHSVDGVKRTIDYTMIEEPADWFFGANFLKVLPRWQFIPRIENGEPVESALIIKYTFCVVTGCAKFQLIPVSRQ